MRSDATLLKANNHQVNSSLSNWKCRGCVAAIVAIASSVFIIIGALGVLGPIGSVGSIASMVGGSVGFVNVLALIVYHVKKPPVFPPQWCQSEINGKQMTPDEEQYIKGLDLWVRQGSKQEKRASAATEIYKCYVAQGCESSISALILDNRNLTSLPDQVCKLPDLTTLSASRNKLTELPPEIENLQNLAVFNLSNNDFSNLPEQLAQLPNLVNLNVNGNLRLAEMPELPDHVMVSVIDTLLPQPASCLPSPQKEDPTAISA